MIRHLSCGYFVLASLMNLSLSVSGQTLEATSKRTESIRKAIEDKDSVKIIGDWVRSLESAEIPTPKGVGALLVMIEWDPWFKDNLFDPMAAKKNVERCKQVKSDALKEWQAGLKTTTDSDPSGLDLLLWITRHDRLFKDEKWNRDESSKLLARLKAVPKASVKKLADTGKIKEVDAVLSLALRDVVFPKEEFSSSEFEKYLTEVKDKVKK